MSFLKNYDQSSTGKKVKHLLYPRPIIAEYKSSKKHNLKIIKIKNPDRSNTTQNDIGVVKGTPLESKTKELIQYLELLTKQNNLDLRVPCLVVKSKDYLNAAIYYSDLPFITSKICLTSEDLKDLSVPELKSLLAHEFGHLVVGTVYSVPANIFNHVESLHMAIGLDILLNLISFYLLMLLIFAPTPTSISKMFLYAFLGIMIFYVDFIMCSHTTDFTLWLMYLISDHSSEAYADTFSIQHTGYKNFVSLMKTFKSCDNQRIHKLEKMIVSLWTCPMASLECLVALVGYLFTLLAHPVHNSFNHRIKLAKKLKNKHKLPLYLRIIKKNYSKKLPDIQKIKL